MLEERLEKVEVQRTQMRRARLRNEIPRIALVGYTNAGKSTLFNALTGSVRLRRRQAVRDPRSDRAAGSSSAAARSRSPTPSASCATCRTTWSPRSAPRCRRRARRTCCCTWSTAADPRRETHRAGRQRARPRSAPATSRSCGVQQDRPLEGAGPRRDSHRRRPLAARAPSGLSARSGRGTGGLAARRSRARFGDRIALTGQCARSRRPGPPAAQATACARAVTRGVMRRGGEGAAGWLCAWSCRARWRSAWRTSRAAIRWPRSCLLAPGAPTYNP
jgi:hypothetical protein